MRVRTDEARAANNAGVKKLHGRRRDEGKCIGNAKHGAAYKGGRCRKCWRAKLRAERKAYRAKEVDRVRVDRARARAEGVVRPVGRRRRRAEPCPG